MKRIATIVVMALMAFTASARSVHYFTQSQAQRTVTYLNAQNEMMIYCGYDYEIETYVLINEVWMERVNSAYYEIWVYGYDAYTGDEIYMPLDLQCVWLFSGSRMYNAAQYLRFHVTVNQPTFVWHVPVYNPFVRVVHSPSYARTYHYNVHRQGWMPPAQPAPGYSAPMPAYYMRTPQTPAPAPAAAWTPGREQPRIATPAASQPSRNASTSGTRNVTTVPTTNSTPSAPASSSSTRSTGTSSATRSTGTSTSTRSTGASSSTRSTGTSTSTPASTTPTRTTSTSRSSATSATTGSTTPATRATSTPTTTARQSASSATRGTTSGSATRTSSTTATRSTTPATSTSKSR